MHISFAALRLSFLVLVFLTFQGYAQVNSSLLTPEQIPDTLSIGKVNERPISVVDSSIREYEALLNDSPEDAVILNNLGVMYYLAGRYFESQAMIRKAAFQATQSFQIRTNLALVQYKTHNPAFAISTLQFVLNEDPQQERTRRALCEIYVLENRKAEAFDCYAAMRGSGMRDVRSGDK